MALITIPPVAIEIEIPDLVTETHTLKRKASLFTMTYNQGAKSLTLCWIVSYPELGDLKGLSTYVKEITADNTVMVNATTGAIMEPVITQDEDYVGQYDFFNYLAQNVPVKVHDLIRQYGALADWDL